MLDKQSANFTIPINQDEEKSEISIINKLNKMNLDQLLDPSESRSLF